MPYKKGPNGTIRYYRKSDGRYCDNPSVLQNFNIKPKTTGSEREEKRILNLFKQAQNSKDKNLFEIYTLLENNEPGSVQHINCSYFYKKDKKEYEIDIITKRAFYEIKGGKAKHKYKQYCKQKEIATSLKKDHIVFSPNSGTHQINVLRSKGIKIFNDINDFINYERNKK